MWRQRDFVLLLVAGAVAQVAFGAIVFAEPLIVLSLSGSVVQAGLVTTIIAIVGTISSAMAGTFADRHPRRRTMVICSLIQLPVLGTLAILFATHLINVPVFTLLSAVSTVVGAYTSAPELAAITQLVPAEQIEAANGNYQARMYAAVLIGPILGGVLLSVSPVLLYTVVCAASVVSAALLMLLADRLVVSASSRGGFARDFVVGWRFLLADRSVRGMLFIQFWSNVAVSGALFLLVMSLQQSGYSTAVIGLAQTAIGGGGLLGALLVPVVTRYVRFTALQIISKGVLVVGLAGTTLLQGHAAMVFPLGAALLLSPSSGAFVFARVARIAPNELRGRVLNFHNLASSVGGSVSSAAAGAVAGMISMTVALTATVAAGCASLLSALTLAAWDRRRSLGSAEEACHSGTLSDPRANRSS